MSNFIKRTVNPWTGEWEDAEWIDNYFGPHNYGIKFKNGDVADPRRDPITTENERDDPVE